MPEVSCEAVAIQNNSQWPCSRRPNPQLRLVGVRTSFIYFFYFLNTLSSPPHYKSFFARPPAHLWLHPVTRLQWRLQRGSAFQSCWRLRSVHQRYRLFTGAQSPRKASPAQRIPSLSLKALKTPAAAASEPEPAKESRSQRLSLALSPYAGDGLQIARTFEGARPARPRAVRHSEGGARSQSEWAPGRLWHRRQAHGTLLPRAFLCGLRSSGRCWGRPLCLSAVARTGLRCAWLAGALGSV